MQEVEAEEQVPINASEVMAKSADAHVVAGFRGRYADAG